MKVNHLDMWRTYELSVSLEHSEHGVKDATMAANIIKKVLDTYRFRIRIIENIETLDYKKLLVGF